MGIQLHTVPQEDVKPISYPVLAKFKSKNDSVWLFTGPTDGICIKPAKGKSIRVSTELINLEKRSSCWEILPKGTSFTFTQE